MGMSDGATKQVPSLGDPIKLCIAAPAYGGNVNVGWAQQLIALEKKAKAWNLEISYEFLYNESLVQRARNRLTYYFLSKRQAEWLMFIDTDIMFDPEHILTMLHSDVNLIGGIYPKKNINYGLIKSAILRGVNPEHCSGDFVFMNDSTKKHIDTDSTKPLPVQRIGTGFMLIHRSVFEKIEMNVHNRIRFKVGHWNVKNPDELMTAYFHCEPDDTGNYLSEDWYFCDLAARAGIQTYAAPWVNLTHYGTHAYKGCLLCSYGIEIHEVKEPRPVITELFKPDEDRKR